MTTPWNMARAASRRPLPKPRVMHGPVGQRVYADSAPRVHDNARSGNQCWFYSEDGVSQVTGCRGCGYHVCSCPPKPALTAAQKRQQRNAEKYEKACRESQHNQFAATADFLWSEQHQAFMPVRRDIDA